LVGADEDPEAVDGVFSVRAGDNHTCEEAADDDTKAENAFFLGGTVEGAAGAGRVVTVTDGEGAAKAGENEWTTTGS
jgi:hypothetical protein